jgi:hypothetical protein
MMDSLQAERLALAQAVRTACLQAAIASCEDARMDGLCWEGAWEAAIEALRTVDLEQIVRDHATKAPHTNSR